jgi:TrmH family RNA methyltransferase
MASPDKAVSIRVVLVRPRNPLNIGAAARAMANFGLSELVVVKPYAPVWQETVSAVGAEKLVLAARRADSVDDVMRDRQIVLGTTVVRDRRLRRPLVRLPELSSFLKRSGARRIAILFGPEKTGLSNAYLERCTHILNIPTSPNCPSMNLGQAVAVCAYELTRGRKDFGPQALPKEVPPATAAQRQQLVRQILRLFEATDYLSFLPADVKAEKIRRLLMQWNLRRRDVAILHGICRYTLGRLAKT